MKFKNEAIQSQDLRESEDNDSLFLLRYKSLAISVTSHIAIFFLSQTWKEISLTPPS